MSTSTLRSEESLREARHVERAELLWETFDVPVDEDGDTIENDWLIFEAGHSRMDIWEWFENTLGVSVAYLIGHNEPPVVAEVISNEAMQQSERMLDKVGAAGTGKERAGGPQ
jgi:hypothetical protein